MAKTISGTYSTTVELTTTSSNPVTVTSGAKLTAASSHYGALYGYGGTGNAWTITNAGLINGGTSGNGIQLGSGGNYVGASTITNQTGGTVAGAYGIRMYNTLASSIVNQSGATISGINSRAVYFSSAGTLTNSGVISAGMTSAQQDALLMDSGGVVVNNALATISGYDGVIMLGTGTVTNAGTIKAASAGSYGILFNSAGANRLIVNPGASFFGKVNGGQGTLELTSAISAGTLAATGFSNFGAIQFDAGSKWTLVGNAATQLAGTIQGFATNETIDVTGFAAVSGTYASGLMTLTNISSAHATLHFSGAGLTSGNFGLAGDGTGGTNITFGAPLAPLVFGQTIARPGILATSETVAAGTLTLLTGTVASGTINVGTSLSTGDFTLKPDGTGGTNVIVSTVFGTYGTGISLTGTANNSIKVTGRVSVASGVALRGAAGSSLNWAVNNSGTIVTTANSTGVFLGAYTTSISSGSLTNQSAGVIYGKGYGVFINGAGLVTNAAGGTISAHNFKAVYISGGPGTVVNAGVLLAGNVAVYEDLGGTVTNLSTGTITGAGGIWLQQSGTVTNAGTITSTDASRGAVIFNSNAGSSRLIVDPGAAFNGKIQSLAGSTNVVELASAASAGTLRGFDGTTITNFATLQFDAGSTWTVSGNTLAGGLGSIAIAGFTSNDTIDLTGFAVTGESFASNALVLTNAGGAHATLHIQGAFSSGNFGFVSDGAGGTDITFVTPVPNLIYGQTIDEAGIIATSETVTAGTMLLWNGASVVGTIHAGVSMTTANFNLASDGLGGTNVIVNTAFGSYASGLTLLANPTTIAGTARIGGTANGAIGVSGPGGTTWTLTNLGQINETGAGGYGISFVSSGTITNAALGRIAGTAGGIRLGAGGGVSNQATATISGYIGVFAYGAAGTVVNAGIISGAPAGNYGRGVFLADGGSVANQAGGTINGYSGVVADNVATVVNAGMIAGNATAGGNAIGVYLEAGGSVTNQATGTIRGGIGISGLASTTVVNAGSIGGNATSGIGIALEAGGSVANLAGGIISGGSNSVKFSSGATNRLVVAPGAAFIGVADGGNTVGAGSISTLELASAASAGTLSGLGTKYIDFASVTIDTGASWVLSGANSVGAGVSLTNSDTLTDTGVLTNSGTIGGAKLALSGGQLTNLSAGVITAAYVYGTGLADTLANLGTISAASNIAVYFKADGNVSNAAGAAITGAGGGVKLRGTGATVSNLGRISGGGAPGSYGIYLREGGLVANGLAGSVTSTASVLGYHGIVFQSVGTTVNHGTLVNYGTVIGSGTESAAVVLNNSGTVINGQTGATAALIEGGRYGVASAAGAVVNRATIIATGAVDGSFGVGVSGSGIVSNLGSAALIEGYGGVLIGTDGTVINAGTIMSNQGTSGVAVRFIGGDARLIDQPGAVFIGSIFGGNGGTAVLELASAASAGTISGIGGAISNFTSLVFDAGARWTVSGDASAGGLVAPVISGFTVGDTLDLTGFAAVSRTFANNALVLTDGDGKQATLAIKGDFTTGQFHLTGDTKGGTDITAQIIVAPVIGGTAAAQAAGDNATVNPFSVVTINDVNADGQSSTVTITVTNDGLATDADGTLTGEGLVRTGVGTYTLSGANAVVVTELNALTFTPTAHQVVPGGTVTTGFTLSDTDAAGGTASDSKTTVVATAANDPPAISGTKAGQPVKDETSLFPFSAVSIGDVDLGQTETVTVTLSSHANGALSNLGGGAYDSGTGVFTVTGSDAAVTKAVSGLRFTPTAHQVAPGGSVTTTFTIKATDTAGGTSSDNKTTTFATAVNDPPSITGGEGNHGVTDEATVSPFLAVTIGDVDFGQTETVTVTLSNRANGALSNVGGGAYDSGTGVFTVTGSDAAVTKAVSGLVFTPTAHQVAPGGSVTTTFTIKATDTAGGTRSTSNTAVVATAVNDPPSITGGLGGQVVTDGASLSPFAAVSIGDVDFGQTETVTVTLSNRANGTLSHLNGGAYDSKIGVFSVTGSDAAVTKAVAGLVFTPTTHQVAPGGSVTTTFTIKATDTAGGTSGDNKTTVVTTAANSAPSITGGEGGQGGQTVDDNATSLPFLGVTISDADLNAVETVTVTLTTDGLASDANGILSGNGLTRTGTGTYTLATGTPAAGHDGAAGSGVHAGGE